MTPTEHAHSLAQDAVAGGAKAAPAVVLSFWHWLLDRPVETWVSVAVLIFTILQIVVLIRDKFIRDGKTPAKKARK